MSSVVKSLEPLSGLTRDLSVPFVYVVPTELGREEKVDHDDEEVVLMSSRSNNNNGDNNSYQREEKSKSRRRYCYKCSVFIFPKVCYWLLIRYFLFLVLLVFSWFLGCKTLLYKYQNT
ncbi:hypothetical protein CsatB_015600 [Cannabis sativa]